MGAEPAVRADRERGELAGATETLVLAMDARLLGAQLAVVPPHVVLADRRAAALLALVALLAVLADGHPAALQTLCTPFTVRAYGRTAAIFALAPLTPVVADGAAAAVPAPRYLPAVRGAAPAFVAPYARRSFLEDPAFAFELAIAPLPLRVGYEQVRHAHHAIADLTGSEWGTLVRGVRYANTRHRLRVSIWGEP